ncbi:MAG: type II secretion system protein N [Desulfoprunum sp.]|nr:type II secretion system protein N [Desulfoprunum sp.]
MKTRISAILPLLFITLGCVLAVEGFYKIVEKVLFVPGDEKQLTAQVPEKKQAVIILKRTVEDDARIVLERNLFGPPPSANKEEKSAAGDLENLQATSLDLVLLGTIIGKKDESRAIILEKGKKTQDIYQLGEMVQGAILKEIVRGKVVLNYNSKDEILDMTEAAKYTTSMPTAVAPAVRQEETLPGPEQVINEAAPLPADIPAEETQPTTIRPARRFNLQLPTQPSQ